MTMSFLTQRKRESTSNSSGTEPSSHLHECVLRSSLLPTSRDDADRIKSDAEERALAVALMSVCAIVDLPVLIVLESCVSFCSVVWKICHSIRYRGEPSANNAADAFPSPPSSPFHPASEVRSCLLNFLEHTTVQIDRCISPQWLLACFMTADVAKHAG